MARNARTQVLGGTHVAAIRAGVALGIYFLPILIARASPSAEVVRSVAALRLASLCDVSPVPDPAGR